MLQFIVLQLENNEELREIKETFRALDENGDGELSRDELIEGYERIIKDRDRAVATVDQIIAQVDTEHTGVINYTNFIIATMNRDSLLSDENLENAFKAFDTDGSGGISIEELKNTLGGSKIKDYVWTKLLDEVDGDGNGELDFDEFKLMMKGLLNS